jgi:hypothetical protein
MPSFAGSIPAAPASFETAAALEAQGIETNIFFMSHGSRILFEARLAAIRDYRRSMAEPGARFAMPLADAISASPSSNLVIEASRSVPVVEPVLEPYASMTATAAAECFVAENPKLLGSDTGKRKAVWTAKTRSQFFTAMRLLEKSVGPKRFWELTTADLQQLLGHFDKLPPNHHKTPRHTNMSLDEICDEASVGVATGQYANEDLGLNVPTLNRHFRYIHMAHDWMRKMVLQANLIDWSTFAFDDSRNIREQRIAFPVAVAREVFLMAPWQGCESPARRYRQGRRIIEDSIFWVLPILWYSGMRREEVCKLMVADFDTTTDPDGIPFIRIRNTAAGRVKNEGSVRSVPVADELVRLGLLEFVMITKEKGGTLLFPELVSTTRSMGDSYYARRWTKIAAIAALAPGITLHGIRHMVATELKDARVGTEVRADLLGHISDGETAGRYSKASRHAILLEAVNKIPVVTNSVKSVRPPTATTN